MRCKIDFYVNEYLIRIELFAEQNPLSRYQKYFVVCAHGFVSIMIAATTFHQNKCSFDWR